MKSSMFLAALLVLPVAVFGQGINDAEIAAIVVTANQVDVDAGKLAVARSSNDKVKAFAQLMITDHSGVNQAAVELVTRLKVTPRPSSTSKALQAGGDKNLAHLKTLKGAAFDQAYINHEYAYHQQVIDALDKTLIPGATNAELKALLVKVRPAFVAHRDHAKSLQVHTVVIEGMRYQPEGLTVSAGDTVVWINRDMVPHTVTSASGRVDSKEIAPGKSWTHTVRAAGELTYVCTYHPQMKAILRVR
jgi:putative membrane protein